MKGWTSCLAGLSLLLVAFAARADDSAPGETSLGTLTEAETTRLGTIAGGRCVLNRMSAFGYERKF